MVKIMMTSLVTQDYGPVNLDSVDALTLNWNQIQWLGPVIILIVIVVIVHVVIIIVVIVIFGFVISFFVISISIDQRSNPIRSLEL